MVATLGKPQDIRQQIEALRDLIYQKIQGASLYAPHLQQVYTMLLGIEYTNYQQCAIRRTIEVSLLDSGFEVILPIYNRIHEWNGKTDLP